MTEPDPPDDTASEAALAGWLVARGLEGVPLQPLLSAFCDRLFAAGVPVVRMNVTMRTHHPEFGTIAFRWNRGGDTEFEEFQRVSEIPQQFIQSPIYYLLDKGLPELRQRLFEAEPRHWFPLFDLLKSRGATDYIVFRKSFVSSDDTQPIDPRNAPQGMIISFAGDAAEGFSEPDLQLLRALLPTLAVVLKAGANRQMAEDISATYLGKDAGRRVVSGDILRGSSETISAVIWYFDLKSFTRLSESLPGPAVLELLNDYFALVVEIVEELGGNVLKFMGDGLLAIFSLGDVPEAHAAAVEAAFRLSQRIPELNATRAAQNLATTGFSLAMHAGDVLYGNIGGRTRLDFTVIGPAVNTTARMLGMCNMVDQNIIISSNVARVVMPHRDDIVSLGQYRLRGVTDRQELFTLD